MAGPSDRRAMRLGVAAGMATGLAVTLVGLLWPGLPAGPSDPAARLRIWLACGLWTCAWLVVCVARLARHRFFSAADIDAALSAGTSQARVLQSLTQNTLEQAVLAIVGYGAWLIPADPSLPAGAALIAAACFGVGRLLFILGYARGAAWRSLGFALTFYPTVGLMLGRAGWLLGETAAAWR